MLLQIHLLKIEEFVIDFFVLNIRMQNKVKYSSRKLKHSDFIEDFLDAKVTDKRSQLLKVDSIEHNVNQLGQHVRLMGQNNEHILIKWVLEFWFGASQVTPSRLDQ